MNISTPRLRSIATTVAITLRGLTGHTRRLATSAVAVLLGVAFTAGTLVLTDTLGTSFETMHVDANADVDLVVRSSASFGNGVDAVRDRLDTDLIPTIATTPGVDAAVGRTTGWAQLVHPDGSLLGDINAGVDPIGENWIADPRLTRWRLTDGAPPVRDDDVVVDRAAARSLGVTVGDGVEVLALGGARTMRVSGLATFGDDDARFGAVTVLFADHVAQAALGESGRHDVVLVALADDADPAVVADRLATSVPGGLDVLTGAELGAESLAIHQQDWAFFDTFMTGFAAVALLVGAFIIFNTFSITVAQRTREFALLRSIGAGRGQVLGSVLTESAAIGVLASAAGLIAGVGVAVGLRSVFGVFGIALPDGGIVVQRGSLVTAFAVGVVITAISALVPALRASRIAPIAALRETAIETSAGSRVRLVVGGVVTAGGVAVLGLGLSGMVGEPVALVGLGGLAVFVGIAALGPVLAQPFGRILGRPVAALRGVPGVLARDNATRSPKRTAATAAALMIGVALVGTITIVAASVKASIDQMVTAGVRADAVVESGSFGIGGLDRSVADELRRLPELGAVSGMTLATASLDGEVVDLVGMDTAVVESLLDLGRIDGSIAGATGTGLGADGIAVQTDHAAARGWTLGSALDLTLADGRTRTLTVAALVEDPHIGLPLLVDVAALDGSDRNPFDLQVFVTLADGVGTAEGLAAISSVTDRYANAEVFDRDGFARARAAMVDPLLGVIYALLAFAVLIAALGITNTLSLSIMERTRELGVLRAVGASRAQVRSAVRWESIMIAVFGTVLGLVIGTGFGWAVVRSLESEGIGELAIPVGSLLVIVALASITGVLAAVRPARRAARLDVLEALRS